MAALGRQDPVTTGSYLAAKFSGSNSAARLKRPMGGRCPLLSFELWESGRSTLEITRRRSEAEGTQSAALVSRVDRRWPRAETQCAWLHFFRVVRCVSAEPAAVFVDLLDPALRSAVDAAVAAIVDVTFGGALC